MLEEVVRIARQIRVKRYPQSAFAFVAGSFIRGEATAHSDIDLVVLFDKIANAYRESFRAGSFPVEAFVHDPETLRYFMLEVDCASGIPAMPQMVKEGVVIPEPTVLSKQLKEFADSCLAAGPPDLTEDDRRNRRYEITDLVDDLRDSRSIDELIATGIRLYATLADYYLRSKGLWSAKGKFVPRVLKKTNPTFFERYRSCFNLLLQNGDPEAVIRLSEDILEPDGGFLFEGYRLDAPLNWRRT